MRELTFDYLLDKLNNSIRPQGTQMRLCVPPMEMLAVTIR